MGAKTPASAEKRSIKCEHCQLSFASLAAIKSHERAKHSEKHVLKNTEKSETKQVNKPVFVPNQSRLSKRILLRKKNAAKKEMDQEKTRIETGGRKAKFECPKCLKLFPVYFAALKHIEKRHNDDLDEENSDIKPVLREVCIYCNKPLYDVEHNCEPDKTDRFSCLGCWKKFNSVPEFDQHVVTTHNDNVDVMMFKEMGDFHTWKSAMESQLKVKYLTLSNTSNRQYYQCNFVSPINSSHITHLCPSVVILRQLRKGIKINFYKTHHSHTCPEYELPKQFKDNLDNDINKIKDKVVTDFDELIIDTSLYRKFNVLMNDIIAQSEKINLHKLEKLYNLATEMQSCINDSLNDDDNNKEEKQNKSMTDDQISKVLETRASARNKRNTNVEKDIPIKKKGSDTSLKENNSIKPSTPTNVKSSPLIGSPSFNDSYKEFIETSILPTPKNESNPSKNGTKTLKNGANTSRNGAITPKNDANTPKNDTNTPKNDSDTPKNDSNTLKNDSDTPKNDSNTPNNDISITNVNKSNPKKRKILKTKMGQFTPSPEKKKAQVAKKSKMLKSPQSLNNLSLDNVDYEVVEQENDCNILVLKI